MNYTIYVLDTETTGLDCVKNDVIELSISKFPSNEQKTWKIQPINIDNIDPGALKVNGHKLEDLLWKTSYGKETYLPANKIIIDVENWLMEDGVATENRIMVGHNVGFDKGMLEQLWSKCDSKDSFPFGYHTLDTFQLEFIINYCSNTAAEGYSLNKLNKKYGIVNSKAHSAEGDVQATVELLNKQLNFLKKKLSD
jgi:DNA polymerase III alpha subunit (gram-positive type)